MRRTGQLFHQIIMRENLLRAAHLAARGRRSQPTIKNYFGDLELNLNQMSFQLEHDQFPFGKYQQFTIRDPKLRIITAPSFPERILHHAIMLQCEPVFERWLIDDTFACRLGKGREVAVARAMKFSHRYKYVLKLDVRKYFDSISHEVLFAKLSTKFKDCKLLDLFRNIIHSYRAGSAKGLPIGSLTSQHFANFYLGYLDRHVKEVLRTKGYVRYMDDMLIWHDDKNNLKFILHECSNFVTKELSLTFKPPLLKPITHGVDFLGLRLYKGYSQLNRRSKKRWQKSLKQLLLSDKFQLISSHELQQRMTALTAFICGANVRSWKFRQAVLKRLAVSDQ